MKKDEKPISDQSVSFTYSTKTGCQNAGSEFTFTASQQGCKPPFTYSWDFGCDAWDTGEKVYYTYSNPGTYSVVLTLVDANGFTIRCTNTVKVDSP